MNPSVIDLSHYNGNVDFTKVKAAGIQAVILKATQGVTMIDPKLVANEAAARAAGLLIGAYHYGVAGTPEAQAAFFLSSLYMLRTPILPVLDFERGASNMSLADAQTWMQIVSKAKNVTPILYTGEYLKSFGTQSTLLGYPLWLSEYGPIVKLPAGYPEWALWQFTNGVVGPLPHSIDGVAGEVDVSCFNGTNDELAAFWQLHSS